MYVEYSWCLRAQRDVPNPTARTVAAIAGFIEFAPHLAETGPHRSIRRHPMIVPFFEATSGVAVYINPAFVISLRPDPADPEGQSIVKLSDGETIRVRGGHDDIAPRLSRTTAAA